MPSMMHSGDIGYSNRSGSGHQTREQQTTKSNIKKKDSEEESQEEDEQLKVVK